LSPDAGISSGPAFAGGELRHRGDVGVGLDWKELQETLGRGAESTLGLGTVSRDRREFSETADSSLVKLATTGTSLP
jgi:hypothetical protein